MKKILIVFGTRPEVIKLAPVILELKKHSKIKLKICATAQHREMLDQVLKIFEIIPDIDLNLMKPNQTLSDLSAKILIKIDKVIKNEKPDIVLVQGDTTTAMTTALVSFYNKIPVGHIEAGLRSNNLYSPFPEEVNRKIISMLSYYHFTPTEKAKNILLNEGLNSKQIFMTGNTVVDALQIILNKPVSKTTKEIMKKIRFYDAENKKELILVTTHRRENFGKKLENICQGIKQLTKRNQNIIIVFLVHPNPNVCKVVNRILGKTERVLLIKPVEYDTIVHLMKIAKLILTDSGGIQEEAPSMKKPILVMRNETERFEGIEAGIAKLIGTDTKKIVEETEKLLKDSFSYNAMIATTNPYGDGKTTKRIVNILLNIKTLNLK